MNLIIFFKKKSIVYTICYLLFIVEWLALCTKYLICVTAIHTGLTFITFVFLEIYKKLRPSMNQEEKLILTKLLKFTELLSLATMFLTCLLLVILSILVFIHQILTALLSCELLFLLILDLQIIFLKFFVKTWMWIFLYIKIYKFYGKIFFEFKKPLDKFGNFLLKIFPTISRFIVFISFSLIYCVVIYPNYIVYL
jgi:hypothetical protein